jgi:hypothetical protein
VLTRRQASRMSFRNGSDIHTLVPPLSCGIPCQGTRTPIPERPMAYPVLHVMGDQIREANAAAEARAVALLTVRLVGSPGVEHALFLLARQSGGRILRGFATSHPIERVHDGLLERPDP